jgi:2',3'-cyclic-nucleotide 2'-phosphodiesterase (5'-nucleotidase family)
MSISKKILQLTASAFIAAQALTVAQAQAPLELQFLGRYSTNTYNSGGAEISAYDVATKRLFTVNGSSGDVDIINLSNPALPVLIGSIDLGAYGNAANSVASKNGIIAIAVEGFVKQDSGKVVFTDAFGTVQKVVTVGALPDMITFTPNGNYVLTANEGEPNDSYTIDPEGSVSVINISSGVANATVNHAGFGAYNPGNIDPAIRIYGPGATVAQDLEPEYIAISEDGQTAWVTCQENNALAIINIPTATVSTLKSLGFKNHSLSGNGFDASNQNSGNVNITTWPVRGMYQPDALASFKVGTQEYIISANEGDARAYPGFNEEIRVGNSGYILDSTAFPNAATLKNNNNLGRLNVTNRLGDIDNDNDFDVIYAYGSRSVSIWDANGNLVWDSADQLEQITNQLLPNNFNCSNSNNTKKDRSDDKGPEPEAVTTAKIGDSTYAFIGLERIGGMMVYNITNPAAPYFCSYINTRNFAQTPGLNSGGDLGPEGVLFIPKAQSPNGADLIVLSNEISGTVSIYQVGRRSTVQILHASDFEASVSAIQDAPRFAAIVDTLENTYPNTLILSSGDNFIPSPFSLSGEDPSLVNVFKNTYITYYNSNFANNDLRAGIGRGDISIMNFIGIEASALGNHEFDWGTNELRNIIAGVNSGSAIRWFGAQFPYLSANLNFSLDANLSNITTNSRLENTAFRSNPSLGAAQIATRPKIAPSCIINKNGQKYGIVGATTPILASISSPGATTVRNPGAGTNDMSLLATILQPVIDSLRFAEGCDKIILLAHMQQLSFEKQLATFLNGVDIIIGGGSNTLMADATDRLRAGDVAAETYPFFTTGADGKPTVIINTDGNYKYVGRLVIEFDAAGNIVPASVTSAISGVYPADSLGVEEVWGAGNYAAAFTPGSKGSLVKTICDAIGTVITLKDGNIFGKTAVWLEGRRNFVRTEETNLGNLTAEANLWMARFYDGNTRISIKNGGGIRSAIGYVNAVGSSLNLEPPIANPASGKLQGDISQLDIENSLRFNNQLSLLTLSANGLRTILEHGVRATLAGATPGQFPQIAGVRFSYDPSRPPMNRIVSAVLVDSLGQTTDTLVMNGITFGDTTRTFRIVTLNFLAGGGDAYPFLQFGSNRIDIPTLPAAGPAVAGFALPGSEQDAFAEYMKFNFTSAPYNLGETPITQDPRIENLQQRADDILPLTIGTTSSTSASCINPGSLTLNFTGGGAPYSIQWNGGSASNISSPYTINSLNAGAYTVIVSDIYNAKDTVLVNVAPAAGPGAAGLITGSPASDCVSGGAGARLFQIAAVNNATLYNWSWNGTAGVSISTGNGTTIINLSWTASAIQNGINGTLTVTPFDTCGQPGTASSISIDYKAAAPVTPGSVSGPGKVCPGDVAVYSVAAVKRASVYNWTLPAGMTITQGAGTNIITVSIDNSYIGGNLSLSASNPCGTSPLRQRTLGINTPARPGVISGPVGGVCNLSGVVYTTAGTPSATSYIWTIPAGVNLVSGQGSNSITVDFTSTFLSGSIGVSAVNNCGTGTARTLSITAAPSRPGVISGTFNICPLQSGVAFSVPTADGASSYNWTVPAGASLVSGQGTKNIVVDFNLSLVNGSTIRVNASNACGTSPNRLSTSLNSDSIFCGSTRIAVKGSDYNVEAYPNPAADVLFIESDMLDGSAFNYTLFDVTGKTIGAVYVPAGDALNRFELPVSNLSNGLYFITLLVNGEKHSIRFSVQH